MEFKRFNDRGTGRRVLYAGDDDSDRAAAYLLSLLCDAGYRVDYLPSPQHLERFPQPAPDLLILSDYPRTQVADPVLTQVADAVEAGMSLLVIGGWESLHGRAGEYLNSPLDRVLPVRVTAGDDRVNSWQGVVVQQALVTGPFAALDWSRPPVVAGYNRLSPLPDAEILLVGRHLTISATPEVTFGPPVPLACTRTVGRGRVTVLAFDLAPHWVAGMVDWGLPRRELRLENTGVWVEVGRTYREFVHTLLDLA
ncbi:MAG TPA: glutamine amidotransferase [Spirochaetia bacterium]|nr:glutamine amidotransferase [Spirochaetia bacterium]